MAMALEEDLALKRTYWGCDLLRPRVETAESAKMVNLEIGLLRTDRDFDQIGSAAQGQQPNCGRRFVRDSNRPGQLDLFKYRHGRGTVESHGGLSHGFQTKNRRKET